MKQEQTHTEEEKGLPRLEQRRSLCLTWTHMHRGISTFQPHPSQTFPT